MNDLKEKNYLQQNIKLARVHLMEALGYEVRTLMTGGILLLQKWRSRNRKENSVKRGRRNFY